jgi:uncharacterized protein (TIGR02145 family)
MKHLKTMALAISAISISIFFYNCGGNDPDDGIWTDDGINPEDTASIVGLLELPDGTVLSPKDLTLLTYGNDNEIDSNEFDVDNSYDYQPVFVVDQNDEVKLMAYRYPGQEQLVVNAKSSALAMLMGLPANSQLSDEGKMALVNQVINDAGFSSIIEEFEKKIINGEDLLSTSKENEILAEKLQSYYTTISEKKKGGTDPVKIYKSSNNEITIQNPGKSYATFIGVYKDESEEYDDMLIQERINFFPASAKELVDALAGDFLPETKEMVYEISEEGNYTFKARNGMAGDESFEDVSAFVYNVADFCYDVYSNVIPKSKEKAECTDAIRSALKEHIEKTVDVSMTGEISAGIVYDYLESFVKEKDLNCLYPDMKDGFKKVIKKYLGFTAWISRIGTAGNILFGTYQMAQDNASVDVCFVFVDGELTPCETCDNNHADIDTLVDSRDGEIYEIIKIGDQVWMAENLRYNASGSWLNPDNPCEKYGRLYNWNTIMGGVKDPGVQGLCPNGWHVPTDEEWSELEIALGMPKAEASQTVNRGEHAEKMKSKFGWLPYDMDSVVWNGTNESGFNVFPTGVYSTINGGEGFEAFGISTTFWTSSSYLSRGSDIYIRGFGNYEGVDRSYAFKSHGRSCRCIKN